MKAWMTGSVAGTGTFRCTDCDFPVSLDAADELPACPNCGGTEFVRASLFTTSQQAVIDLAPDVEDHAWLDEVRNGLEDPGQYIAYRSGDDIVAYALTRDGVFVNGERVEWSTLADGDEVVIGRHHLHFMHVPVVSGMRFGHTSESGTGAQSS
jgi:hypothetical protein